MGYDGVIPGQLPLLARLAPATLGGATKVEAQWTGRFTRRLNAGPCALSFRSSPGARKSVSDQ